MATAVPISTRTPAVIIPVRNDQRRRPMLAPSLVRTRNVPMIDANMPIAAMMIGSKKRFASKVPVGSAMPSTPAPTAANAIVAMIDPTCSTWYYTILEPPVPAKVYVYPIIAVFAVIGLEWWVRSRFGKKKS